MYGEDADFALRAKALGYRPVITPSAVVTHEIGVSSATREDKFLLLFRGKVTLLRKHWDPVQSRVGVAFLAAGVGLRALAARPFGRGGGEASGWPALWRARGEWLPGFEPVGTTPPTAPSVGSERLSS